MRCLLFSLAILLSSAITTKAQTVETIIQDNFEGTGTVTWSGDNCGINTSLMNPVRLGMNTSETVLEYYDHGVSQYANVRFDVDNNFDLSTHHTFSLKIYIPSSGLTGSQPNQISLKLQDGTLQEPWNTQSEIVKPISMDEWQTVTFDFENDNYMNSNADSPAPTQRTDFNRLVIQLNGEDNYDQVLAYVDDFYYDGIIVWTPPVFDQLVWSDEFDTDGAINSGNWFHQTLLPTGYSWYNGEVQHHTDRIENSFVEDGVLNIVAKKETFTDQGHTKEYTSARLNSKFAFKYGKIEIRAKMPSGVGTWPAIWMLGKNIYEPGGYWTNEGYGKTSWPACGEIDIMEHWGSNQNYIQSATHTPSSYGGTINNGGRIIPTVSDEFHVYALEWNEERLVFSVDDIVHYTYNPPVKNSSTWPFDAEQYLILNISVAADISPYFEQSSLQIDYVRVYQESGLSIIQIDNDLGLMYYPNPIDDAFNIRLDEAVEEAVTIRIYDIEGKLVETHIESASKNIITLKNLEHLSTGTYIISGQLKERDFSFKVFKN